MRTEISSGSFIGWAETRTGASELAEGATHDIPQSVYDGRAKKYKEKYVDKKKFLLLAKGEEFLDV